MNLRSLASVAIWSGLMKWRSIIPFFSPLQQFTSELENNSDDFLRKLIGTWYGFLFVVLVSIIACACALPLLWESVRDFALTKYKMGHYMRRPG